MLGMRLIVGVLVCSLLTACGAVQQGDKSTAKNQAATKPATSTGTSTVTANINQGTISMTIAVADLSAAIAGSKMIATLTPQDGAAADARVLVEDFVNGKTLQIAGLAAKTYRLSLQLTDKTGKVLAAGESAAVVVSAGDTAVFKVNLTQSNNANVLIVEPVIVPAVNPGTHTAVTGSGPYEFVRDFGCIPVEYDGVCKDGSIPQEKIVNERCRIGNSCNLLNESCVFSRKFCQDGSEAVDSFSSADPFITSCKPKGTASVGGKCKSSARFKRDVHYIDANERQALSAAILNTKLSKYYYKDTVAHDKALQLGFIVEDQPADSIFLTDDKSGVNLYAFTSGAVAAIQQLHQELQKQTATIQALEKELARTKKDASGLGGQNPR